MKSLSIAIVGAASYLYLYKTNVSSVMWATLWGLVLIISILMADDKK